MLGFMSVYNLLSNEIKNNGHIKLVIDNELFTNINNFETLYDFGTQNYYFNKIFFDHCDNNKEQFLHIITIIENLVNLSYIDVKIYDKRGHLQKNLDNHWFVLEIVYLEDRLIGTNIESTRGTNRIGVNQ